MVSNLDFNCETVHVGVTRRSVRNVGSAFAFVFAAELGEVIMTEISAGVGWKAIFFFGKIPRLYFLILISDLVHVLIGAGVCGDICGV